MSKEFEFLVTLERDPFFKNTLITLQFQWHFFYELGHREVLRYFLSNPLFRQPNPSVSESAKQIQ